MLPDRNREAERKASRNSLTVPFSYEGRTVEGMGFDYPAAPALEAIDDRATL